ncbi:MAG: response regulator [Oligoflexia bacterium]|nr:response regulator [Oligoflexia bacterium]
MKNLKVLIIEDDKVALDYLAKFVQAEGFIVIVAENGEDGLLLIKKEMPDILITDYKMPGITGIEIMKKAQDMIPDIQTILVTAFGDTALAIAAIQEGAIDYLKKPIDLAQLKIALGRAIEKIADKIKFVFRPNIAIVDDEEDARHYLSHFLRKEKEDWNILVAADGAAAVELFKSKKIDVVVIDIKMPKMSGLQAIAEMRTLSSDFESIVLTGHGDESDAILALRNGAMNFLKKPFDLEEVLVNIEKALEKLAAKKMLFYRARENELAGEIIAKITSDNKIIIHTQQMLAQNVANFADELLATLPMVIFMVDSALNINQMNGQTARLLNSPIKVDEAFMGNLKKFGVECSLAELSKEILDMINTSTASLKKIKTGEHSSITLLQITLLSMQNTQYTAVLMGISLCIERELLDCNCNCKCKS